MAKFNVGDKVICVDAEQAYGSLKSGEIYTIDAVSEYYVELVGTEYEWDPKRFHLVKPVDKPSEPDYPNYSLHELLDRIGLCQQIIEDHVTKHSLGHLVEKEIMLAQGHLYKAYNKIAEIHLKD